MGSQQSPDANRVRERFEQLCEEVRTATAGANLPPDNERWDPYLRVLLRALAFTSVRHDDARAAAYYQLWELIGRRICPDLLQPVPPRLAVEFSKRTFSQVVDAGTELRFRAASVLVDHKTPVVPLAWGGGELQKNKAFLRLDKCGDWSGGPLRLFAAPSDQFPLPTFLNALQGVEVACLQGSTFNSCGWLLRPELGRTFYRREPLVPVGDDLRFREVNCPLEWQPSKWGDYPEGFWLRLTFRLPAAQVIPNPARPPFALNTGMASCLVRESAAVSLRHGEAAASTWPKERDGSMLVAIESIRADGTEFAPAEEVASTARGAEEAVFWQDNDSESVRVLLRSPRACDATVQALYAPQKPPDVRPGEVSVPQLLNRDLGLVSAATALTSPAGGSKRRDDSRQLIDTLAFFIRTRNRPVSAPDYEQFARGLDPRICKAEAVPILDVIDGRLSQKVLVKLQLLDHLDDHEAGALAEYVQSALAARSPVNLEPQVEITGQERGRGA